MRAGSGMRGKFRAVFFLAAFMALVPLPCGASGLFAADVAAMPAARGQERLIVVLAPSARASVYAFERKDGAWREVFRTGGFVGRGGVSADKKEGDGRTPKGVFTMREAFGGADNPGSFLPYHVLRPGDFWVDDPASRYYNRRVRGELADRDWNSAEDLIRQSAAYRYAVVIDYNTQPVVRGAGSAIFLHCSTGGPTAGCVSVPEKEMIRLLRFIRPGDRIAVGATLEDLQ